MSISITNFWFTWNWRSFYLQYDPREKLWLPGCQYLQIQYKDRCSPITQLEFSNQRLFTSDIASERNYGSQSYKELKFSIGVDRVTIVYYLYYVIFVLILHFRKCTTCTGTTSNPGQTNTGHDKPWTDKHLT